MALLYVVSFLDRANISFAKQAMQASIGISEHTYALAAGLFFISYSLCGFPSNLILHRVGAKRWLSFLMIGWGLLSMATMFVTGGAFTQTARQFLDTTKNRRIEKPFDLRDLRAVVDAVIAEVGTSGEAR